MTAALPSPAQQDELFTKYRTPEAVIAHGEAVAICARELAEQLHIPVDLPLLLAACRLHDIAREHPDHARAGAELLIREGYPALGALVAPHHDLPENAANEAALVYLADKLVQGTERVTLEERFAASREKCRTPEALAAWQRRRDRAYQIVQAFHLTLPESEVSP